MQRVAILVAALALFTGPAASAPASAVDDARSTIDRANADWLPAMRAADAARVAKPYAEEGVFVQPNGQTVVGRAAIAEMYRKGFVAGRKVVGGDIHQDGMSEVPGGLILEWGHAATENVAPGEHWTSAGSYVAVWKKGADGRWAIIRNLAF